MRRQIQSGGKPVLPGHSAVTSGTADSGGIEVRLPPHSKTSGSTFHDR